MKHDYYWQMIMIKLTIDNKKVKVPEGSTILEAARSASIRIPTLCFHDRLNPIGSCRLCLVEIEGCSDPVTACTTPVKDGISVITNSDRLFHLRQNSLKLILTNYPLECQTCEKNGACSLQILIEEFGINKNSYTLDPVIRNDEYSTPLINYKPQYCIMCLRCVSACREIKGLSAIDITDTGYNSQVSPVNKDKCESCGECLMVCPTVALTENLTLNKNGQDKIKRISTTCAYCGCGCQLELNVINNKITKVTTNTYQGVNRGSLCVKGRFGYEFINSKERLTRPLIKENGIFKEATWDKALSLVADRFLKIKQESGPDAIAGLSSARCTNEENYLFQKFFRAVIGTNNIDHCARL